MRELPGRTAARTQRSAPIIEKQSMWLPRFYHDGPAPASDLPGGAVPTGAVIPSCGSGRKECGFRRLPL